MGRGYRWMYRLTGLPGWMRYGAGYYGGPWGYEAGPPWWEAGPYRPGPWGPYARREDELSFLKDEAESVREYLEELERRIGELEKKETETA